MRRASTISLLFAALLHIAPAAGDEPAAPQVTPSPVGVDSKLPAGCLHMVFSRYCLGGGADSLPAKPDLGGGAIQIWVDEGLPTAVMVRDGRVVSVARVYRPGSWLTYSKVVADTTAKHGAGFDSSSFPRDARDPSSKEAAVAMKKGEAVHNWGFDGWLVSASWEDKERVLLLYALFESRTAKPD